MQTPVIFERGEHVYLVGPVAPFKPESHEIEELAFASALRDGAPNQNLVWMRGQYVEADRPNDNGALFTAEELQIKSLTPRLMPVTVMHDPRTAVGLIADTRMLTREKDQVPRSRIDTTLGLWGHRFPDVVEEALINYQNGTLMQSMEALPGYYECSECGMRFAKLAGGAEKANWCSHLKGEENAKAARRLGAITFTGTGLIFGTRGARGAYSEAHLEVFQEEVAEFHEKAHVDARRSIRRRSEKMDTIEIKRDEYDALKAKASKTEELEQRVASLEESTEGFAEVERQLEATETAKVVAEKERDELKTKLEAHEEQARAQKLAKDRFAALGGGFVGKLGDFTRGRLEDQAGKLSEEEWDARLKELEETAGVKRDDGASVSEDEGVFTREELARAQLGTPGNGGNGGEPSAIARRSVVAGLAKTVK